MKEIIGDDYPTYEDSVNATLAEKFEKKLTEKQSFSEEMNVHTYLKEVEYKIHKDNLERLMKENLELRHRLDCIASDIELVARHICKYDSAEIFKLPSLESNGKIFADEAWHNITNIEIACDLNDDSSLGWGAKCTHELDNLNRDL